MADPKPIQQDIKIEAQTDGAKDVVRELGKVQDATRDASGEAQKAGQTDRDRSNSIKQLEGRLKDLILMQRRHEQQVKDGKQLSEQEIRVGEERRRQIKMYSRDLAKLENEQDQVNRELRESVDAHRASAEGAEHGAQKTSLFGDTLGSAGGAVAALTGGIVGGGGLVAALGILADDLQKNVEAAREFQEAFLNLQFLSDTFNEQEKEFVGKASVYAGRQPAEVAESLAEVKSFFPGKSDKENQELLLEAAELARTTPAPLSDLVSPLLGLVAAGQSPQEAQNTLRATIVQGGVSDPGVVGGLLGEVLSPSQRIGNLSAAESAGLVAGATGLDKRSPEQQITALKSILLNLQGDKTPDQQKLIEQGGIDTTTFLTSLETLGVAIEQGKIDSAGIDRLVGSEGVSTAASLGDREQREVFLNKVNAVLEASKSDRDLTAEAIKNQFQGDEATALNFAIKQVEAADTVSRAQPEALSSDLAAKLLDLNLKDSGVGPVRRWFAQRITKNLQAIGVNDDTAIEFGGDSITGGEFFSDPGARADDYTKAQLEAIRDGATLDEVRPDHSDAMDAAIKRVEERLRKEREAGSGGSTDQSSLLDPNDLDDMVQKIVRGLQAQGYDTGQQPVIQVQRVVINNGTNYQGMGNPLIDDLDGRDRV